MDYTHILSLYNYISGGNRNEEREHVGLGSNFKIPGNLSLYHTPLASTDRF